MPDIGTAYISIVPETSRIAPGVRAALRGVDGNAGETGRTMGSRMAGALGGALKAGAATAAAAGVATIGTAMVKGFERLSAIDQAKAKLSGLGNSASDVTKIMDNALSSVRGTAFGMGDAAGLAGTMVAAGIKPGKELESTLKRVADSAAIAGTDLGDMGMIWGKAAAKGKLDGEIVNQMLERQIPIYDILGKKMGKNAEEIAKMVSEGKISFQDFSDAMNDKVGGAALKSGETVKGAFNNMTAALGRVGASALEPFFKRMPAGLGGITAALDELEPKIKLFAQSLDSKIFDEWGPKLEAGMESFRETGAIDDLMTAMRGLSDAGANVAPAMLDIGKALAAASGALGVGTWQLFLGTLNAVAGALNILSPVLEVIGNFMQAHPRLVAMAAGAWMLFRTVPALMGRVTSALNPVSGALTNMASTTRGAATGLRSIVTANGALVATSRGSLVEMGRFGSAIDRVGDRIPVVSRMQGAFINAAEGANRFGRTAGTFAAVRTAMNGVGNAGGALVNALGGGLNASILGITVVGGLMISSFQRQSQIMKQQEAAAKSLADSHFELQKVMLENNGVANDVVMDVATNRIDLYRASVEATTKADGKWHEAMYDGIGKTLGLIDAGEGLADMNDKNAGKAQEAQKAFDKLGMSTETVGKKVYGSGREWNTLRSQLMQMGSAGQEVANDLGKLRQEFVQQKNLARQLTPGFGQVAEAIKLLGDDSATSADKMNALKTAMDALNPTRNKAEAMKQWGNEVRAATEAASGVDGSAFDMAGNLDASTEAGGKLVDVLGGLAEKAANVASTGGDMTKVAKEQDAIFEQLATTTGKTKEEIKEIYNSMGGNVVDIAVKLKGAPESIQQLGAIKAAMDANPDLKTFNLKAEGSEQVQAALTQLGIKMTKTPDGKVIKVDLSGDAGKKLQDVINAASQIPAGKDVKVNAPGGQAVFELLKSMGVEVKTNNDKQIQADIPNGSPVLQILRDLGYEVETRNGKTIIVKANDDDYKGKKDDWTADVYKNVNVRVREQYESAAGVMGPGPSYPPFHSGGYTGPGAKYQPAGVVHADEFVIRKESRQKIESAHPGLLDSMNQSGAVGYADGGRVGFSGKQLRELAEGGLGASQPLTGAPYVWGGVNWGDCSSAQSAFARAAVGLDPFGGRMSTGSMGSDLPAMGFQQGPWQPGTMGVGFINGGPGGGHTAGTLPDGTNVEMGGGYGGGMVGGTVGANDGQFTDHWFFPVRGDKKKFNPFQPFSDEYERDPNYKPGQNGGDTSGSGSGGKGASFSERLGGAASAFVGGQLSSLFGVLGINDSPGGLAALNEYESQRGQNQNGTGGKPSDPGTHKPAEGEDTGKKDGEGTDDKTEGKADTNGLSGIKDAFKKGLREAWRTGAEWDATDWIVNKESTWNPAAENGKYHGLIQAGAEVYEAAGVDPTTVDPEQQAKAFDKYVEGRYKLPTAAKTFHEANNWYDNGGIAGGIGHMLKNTVKPERVLSPSQTASFEQMVKRDFQGGGDKEMLARMDRLIALTERLHERISDVGGDTFNFPDRGNARDNITQVQRAKRVAKLAGV